MLTIITDENPILRKKSIPINPKEIQTKELKKLYKNMIDTMQIKNGIGLAAPQIGKNICLIVIQLETIPNIKQIFKKNLSNVIMINPKITRKSWSKESGEEGCLSIPDVYGKVKRYKKITCTYLDADNKLQKIKVEKLLARVIQHEIDHLNGVLFTDKVA